MAPMITSQEMWAVTSTTGDWISIARMPRPCSLLRQRIWLELELVEKANGLKLITNAFGEQSVRYSDGTVDKMSEVPLCLIKLKLAYEFDRFSEFLMKRKMHLKDRLDCFMFKTEMQLACHLFDTVKAMRDEK